MKQFKKLILSMFMILSTGLYANTVNMAPIVSYLLSDTTQVEPSTLKKTGQTISYDAAGNVVTDDSLKDDGFYQKGVMPSYSRINDIVTDNITGLEWQDDEAVITVDKQWLNDDNYNTCYNDTTSVACYDTSGDTAATYCAGLTLGGHFDWRVPTNRELEGLVDYGKAYIVMDTTYFYNIGANLYWSSTTLELAKNLAWHIHFYSDGDSDFYYKISENYVRCVRGGQ